ncbi:MAG: hypothetical protein ACNS63_10720 [Candidatus Nitrospinota bacterium M3_3B_026]
MAPITGIASAAKALSLYDRQQFYANRTSRVRTGRVYQVGARDRVDISAEAMTRATVSEGGARPAGRAAEGPITYDRPRGTTAPREESARAGRGGGFSKTPAEPSSTSS